MRSLIITVQVAFAIAIVYTMLNVRSLDRSVDELKPNVEQLNVRVATFESQTAPATEALLCTLALTSLPEDSIPDDVEFFELLPIACPNSEPVLERIRERIRDAFSSTTTTTIDEGVPGQ
jgi:hypothetical protein